MEKPCCNCQDHSETELDRWAGHIPLDLQSVPGAFQDIGSISEHHLPRFPKDCGSQHMPMLSWGFAFDPPLWRISSCYASICPFSHSCNRASASSGKYPSRTTSTEQGQRFSGRITSGIGLRLACDQRCMMSG
jgi:hypothetical protein